MCSCRTQFHPQLGIISQQSHPQTQSQTQTPTVTRKMKQKQARDAATNPIQKQHLKMQHRQLLCHDIIICVSHSQSFNRYLSPLLPSENKTKNLSIQQSKDREKWRRRQERRQKKPEQLHHRKMIPDDASSKAIGEPVCELRKWTATLLSTLPSQ